MSEVRIFRHMSLEQDLYQQLTHSGNKERNMNPDYIWAIIGGCSLIILFIIMLVGDIKSSSH
jgi:CHASE3 domain sensor protein